jgi:hypothetical protein
MIMIFQGQRIEYNSFHEIESQSEYICLPSEYSCTHSISQLPLNERSVGMQDGPTRRSGTSRLPFLARLAVWSNGWVGKRASRTKVSAAHESFETTMYVSVDMAAVASRSVGESPILTRTDRSVWPQDIEEDVCDR